MTNDQLFNMYSQYQQSHVAPSTYAARMSIIRRWALPVLGKREVRVVSPSDINTIYNYMEQAGLSVNTLFSAYAAFLSLFKFAVDRGYIDNNPVSSARRYRPTYEQEDRDSWSYGAKGVAAAHSRTTAATAPTKNAHTATASSSNASA